MMNIEQNQIICPECKQSVDYCNVMGDSDWDDQEYEWYETDCPKCGKYIKIRQYDVEVLRCFETKSIESNNSLRSSSISSEPNEYKNEINNYFSEIEFWILLIIMVVINTIFILGF
ncbi:unnamed protein product [marine sediment metagenome]|uniref:Uncharacterized protein n=1 Tax=marine sediment metagenome TaxID=412755 RepID=X1DJR0_9ZZZZ